jgi:helicase
MHIDKLERRLHNDLYRITSARITELRPAQAKAVQSGLLEGTNLLVCTPTASGKTLIAELAMLQAVYEGRGKALYIVPLKALASEKHKDFAARYPGVKVALTIGDLDSKEPALADQDIIITTSEKLDSLIRHHTPWLRDVRVVVVDEIHLLNDPGRGPTLEILITILKKLLKDVQIIGLSATIGNPEELAGWLEAELVEDSWRPVQLKKGVYQDGKIEFKEEKK